MRKESRSPATLKLTHFERSSHVRLEARTENRTQQALRTQPANHGADHVGTDRGLGGRCDHGHELRSLIQEERYMKIETRKLTDIKPYPGNPRQNDAAVAKVA